MGDGRQILGVKLTGDCSTWGINDQIMPSAGKFHKCIFQQSKNCECYCFVPIMKGYTLEDKALTSLLNYGSICTWMLMIDKSTIIHRGWIKNPSSVTKWTSFTQLVCFLSNIINFQEELRTIQQTEKKQKCTSFLGVCMMSLISLWDIISKQN